MNKYALFLCACVVLLSFAGCDIKDTPEMEDENSSVAVDISIPGLSPGTKAIKSSWEKGDIINVYVDGAKEEKAYIPDFTLTYDGTKWASSPLSEDAASRLNSSGAKLRGFWEGSNSCISSIAARSGWTTYMDLSINVPGWSSKSGAVTPLIADFSEVPYTYDGKTLRAAIDKWHFGTDIQIVIEGLPKNTLGYHLYSTSISSIAGILTGEPGSGTFSWRISLSGSSVNGRIAGMENRDGLAFAGQMNNFHINNPTFYLVDNDTKKTYSYSRENVSLESASGTRIVAVRLPFSEFRAL